MESAAGKYYIASGYGSREGVPDMVVFRECENGKMKAEQRIYCGGGPSYLAAAGSAGKGAAELYVSLEYSSEVAGFLWSPSDRKVQMKSRIRICGQGLCHLSVAEQGSLIYGSCYGSGDFFALDTEQQKVIWKQKIQDMDSGKRAEGEPHAHCISLMDDQAVFLTDLGLSDVRGLCLKNGIPGEELCRLEVKAEEGPRQFLPFQSGSRAVVINEKGNTFSVWSISREGSRWIPERLYTRKTTGKSGENWPGGAQVWKERILFAANRGADTIAAFDLEDSGRMIGEWDAGGIYPRHILVTEEGLLFAACQKSGEIVSMRWNGSGLCICDRLALPGAACIMGLA